MCCGFGVEAHAMGKNRSSFRLAIFIGAPTASPRAFHPKSRSHRTITAPGGLFSGVLRFGHSGTVRRLHTMARHDFTQSTKQAVAKRVAYRCSNPTCHAQTIGPHSESTRFVNIGVASHITAASPGGPRFDGRLSQAERSAGDNCIWLCQLCAKLIDSDEAQYTIKTIGGWKLATEQRTTRALVGIPEDEFFPQPDSAFHTPIPRIAGLTYDDARYLLVRAGWQPRMNHWTHASNFEMQYGNGLHFWNKGYHEIRHASGSGLALCSFGFEDVYGRNVVVVTAGEVIEEMQATACIWRWYFERDAEDA